MPGSEQLRYVKPGDRPSASQHNILVDAAKAKYVGDQAFSSERGHAQRPNASKYSKIARFRVDEDVPTGDPTPARDFLKCVELDGDEVVSDQIVVALTEHTKPLSHLYSKNLILFAAEVIDDMGITDNDGLPVQWLEIVPPAFEEATLDPFDLTITADETGVRTETWDRDDPPLIAPENQEGGTYAGCTVPRQRIGWDDEVPGLVAFSWTETFDVNGKLVEVSEETKSTIITFKACDEE
ncbi:MAG: hypothetical protein ACF8OB_02925 [Phycisphaeraceae bacterium JB051]